MKKVLPLFLAAVLVFQMVLPFSASASAKNGDTTVPSSDSPAAESTAPFQQFFIMDTIVTPSSDGKIDKDHIGLEIKIISNAGEIFTWHSIYDGDRIVFEDLSYELKWQPIDFDSWVVGETYSATACLYDPNGEIYSATFNVTVAADTDPIQKFSIQDVVVSPLSDFKESNNSFIYTILLEGTIAAKSGVQSTFSFYSGEYNWISVDNRSYSLYFDPIDFDSWIPGKTYKVTARLNGYGTQASASFCVRVEESPVERIEVLEQAPIYCYTGGYYSHSDDPNTGYIYRHDPTLKITLQDGRILYGSQSIDLGEDYVRVYYQEELPQSEAEWIPGQTYTVTAGLAGVTDTFTISILESPITSLSIENIKINYSNLLYENYYSYSNDLVVTAKLKDGQEIKEVGGITIDGTKYFVETFDDQNKNPWEKGKTYTAQAALFGILCDFEVKIGTEEDPKKVVSIEAEDTVVMQGTNMYAEAWENPAYSDGIYRYFTEFTATLADGTVLHSENGRIITDDVFVDLFYTDDQETTPWEVGKTYTATAKFGDVSDTFQITVVDSCIESVEFDDVTVIEGSGKKASYYDPEQGKTVQYTRYNYHPSFTVTFKNGEKETFHYPHGMSWDYLRYTKYASGGWSAYGLTPIYTDNQIKEHWQPGGTYQIEANFLGFKGTFQISVIENPVESFFCPEKVRVLCELDNPLAFRIYSGEELTMQGTKNFPLSVRLKDGTIIESADSIDGRFFTIYGERYFYSAPFYFEQFGDYVCSAEIFFLSEKYQADVPVEAFGKDSDGTTYGIRSVEIPDISVFADTYDLFWIYPTATVTLNSGEKISVNMSGIKTDDWKVGEHHQLSASVGGVSAEYTVSVIENPIEGLAVKQIISTDPYTSQALTTENGTVRYVTSYRPRFFYFLLKDGSIVVSNNYTVDIYNIKLSIDVSDNHMTELEKQYSGYITVGGKRFDYEVIFTNAVPGDINIDGKVSLADVLLAARFAIGSITPTPEQLQAGDVNKTGKIELADVITLAKIAIQ